MGRLTKSTLPAGNAEFHPEAAVELGVVFCSLGEYSVASVPFTGSCLCEQPPGKEKQRVCWQRCQQGTVGGTQGPRG